VPSEKPLEKKVLLACSGPDTRLFRNASSRVWFGHKVGSTSGGNIILGPGAHIGWAGLTEGSGDIIGIHKGFFVSIELKTPGTRTTPKQKRWCDMVRRLGGLAGIATSVEEAQAILEGEIVG
jgi:hypothetical protein